MFKGPLSQTDQTTDTAQKSRTYIFKILNNTNTTSGENCESSSAWIQMYKPRNISALFSQCGS